MFFHSNIQYQKIMEQLLQYSKEKIIPKYGWIFRATDSFHKLKEDCMRGNLLHKLCDDEIQIRWIKIKNSGMEKLC